jgi:hypothetical protein
LFSTACVVQPRALRTTTDARGSRFWQAAGLMLENLRAESVLFRARLPESARRFALWSSLACAFPTEERQCMKMMLACVLSLCAVTGSAHAKKCFQDKITQVHTGRILASYGHDGGMAIFFHTASGQMFPIDLHYNMNDAPGPAMYSTLTSAMTNDFQVAGFDASGQCNKISTLAIVNY